MKYRNCRYLEQQWLHGGSAEDALQWFEKHSAEELQRLLRHHSEEEIRDEETYRRDEFDDLLAFYAMMELGAMVGFVDEIPAQFIEDHLPILCEPAVRRYYELHYPYDLARRFRERLQSGVAYAVKGGGETAAAFFEYMSLTQERIRDPDVESFLWCLDDGSREVDGIYCDIGVVVNELRDPRRVAAALQRREDERTEVEKAVVGFTKFVGFCEAFQTLLRSVGQWPELAEAMWLGQAYWFRRMEATVGKHLHRAIESVAKWELDAEDAVAKEERVRDLVSLFAKLKNSPLSDWKLGLWGGPVAREVTAKLSMQQKERLCG